TKRVYNSRMLKPLSRRGWNFQTAAHLVNRAGFGGAPSGIEKVRAMGLEKAGSHFVDFEKNHDPTADPGWAETDQTRANSYLELRRLEEKERREKIREIQRTQRERMMELRGWWLRRMLEGPRPFQEKMVLFWHGHFATSVEKVREPYLMWRQNEL